MIHAVPLVLTQHVVFEEIGRFAGATSYIHVALHLDLGDLQDLLSNYEDQIDAVRRLIWEQDLSLYTVGGTKPTGVLEDLLQRHKEAHEQILQLAEFKLQQFQSDFARIQLMYPSPVTRNSLPDILTDPNSSHSRHKRFLGTISSILGTFMGIYTQTQINSLASQISDLDSRTQKLLDITSKHTLQLSEHKNYIRDLSLFAQITTVQNPAITLQQLSIFERNITRAFDIARSTFQMAQFRRLSIDFLKPEHLIAIFEECQRRATLDKATLIPEKHSDLFQLELSYIFNGREATFILHVPTIPKGALLRLLRFHSFPLIYEDVAFLPKPEFDVLALTDNFEQLSLQINHADLMDCQHNNRFYICERHGILNRVLNSTCLGALYSQRWNDAIDLCHMEIGYQQEAVLHLNTDRYLVYSPTAFTAPIQCGEDEDARGQEIVFRSGITETRVPQGCSARLNEHKIISDSAITLDTDIKHFEWDFTPLTKHLETREIKDAFRSTAGSLRMTHMTLTDLLQNIQTRQTEVIHKNLLDTFTAELQSTKEEIPQLPSFSALFIMVYFALALSLANFLYLIISTSVTIHFRKFFNFMYQTFLTERHTRRPPQDIEMREMNC